jgi:hypothetical protein
MEGSDQERGVRMQKTECKLPTLNAQPSTSNEKKISFRLAQRQLIIGCFVFHPAT